MTPKNKHEGWEAEYERGKKSARADFLEWLRGVLAGERDFRTQMEEKIKELENEE